MSDSLLDRANKGILGLKPYEPGKPIEETQKELGLKNIIRLLKIINFKQIFLI